MEAKGYITVKGITQGITRPEYEYEIPLKDAFSLMRMSISVPIIKMRYIIEHLGNKWEVDVFYGKNKGLIIAEIELETEYDVVTLPEWIDREVSDDPKYYNSNLAG